MEAIIADERTFKEALNALGFKGIINTLIYPLCTGLHWMYEQGSTFKAQSSDKV